MQPIIIVLHCKLYDLVREYNSFIKRYYSWWRSVKKKYSECPKVADTIAASFKLLGLMYQNAGFYAIRWIKNEIIATIHLI
jgi:hypothetical protein